MYIHKLVYLKHKIKNSTADMTTLKIMRRINYALFRGYGGLGKAKSTSFPLSASYISLEIYILQLKRKVLKL